MYAFVWVFTGVLEETQPVTLVYYMTISNADASYRTHVTVMSALTLYKFNDTMMQTTLEPMLCN